MVPEPLAGCDPVAVRNELLDAHEEFWDRRDLRSFHHPMWLRQFAGHGLVVRDGDRIVAYLLGVVTADGMGYVHVIAVRRAYRGRGFGRALWAEFASRAAGARELQAITTPTNAGSIAFHTSLGMTASTVADYNGEGQPRVLFRASPSTFQA